MSNNSIIVQGQAIEISKDGAVAWGGTWDPTFHSDGGLTSTVGTLAIRGTQIWNGGKHYFEVTPDSWNGRYGPLIGVMGENESDYGSPNSYSYWTSEALKYHAGSNDGAFGLGIGAGDRLGLLLDQDAGVLVLYKNGVSMGTVYSGIPKQPMRPFATAAGSAYTATVTANFAGPFM